MSGRPRRSGSAGGCAAPARWSGTVPSACSRSPSSRAARAPWARRWRTQAHTRWSAAGTRRPRSSSSAWPAASRTSPPAAAPPSSTWKDASSRAWRCSGMRRPLLAANWKMNPIDRQAAVDLARGVSPAAAEHASRVDVAVFPPFCWLVPVASALDGTVVALGAQDCYWERSGAFTGEVSAAMLAGWCDWVIVGHSERRGLFGETDEQVARKAGAALEAGLSVIVAVGEREDQLDAGLTEQVCRLQLSAAMKSLQAADARRVVIAYEPVWAIGTGRNADPAHAGATMAVVRRELEEGF